MRALLCLTLLPSLATALSVDCDRLLDVRSGQWRENVRVEITDGRITALQPRKDAADIRLTGLYCLPGLMDMHTHLTTETQGEAEALRGMLSGNPADAAYRSVGFAERTLLAGFTTARDLGSGDNVDIALKRAIAKGWVRGPRLFTAGKSIATTGGHADPTNSLNQKFSRALGDPGPAEGVVAGADEARRAVRQRYKDGADLIKITATGGVLSLAASGQNPQFVDEELAAIIATARDYGFKVAAHAHGAEGMKRALRAGVDSIEHGTYMDDAAIALFKKSGAWYVPTISAGKFVAEKSRIEGYYAPIVRPKAAAVGPQIQSTFGRAWKAGVKIAFGTDAGVFPHGDNAREFIYMHEAGMPALEAVRSATLNAAELLGRSTELGELKAGYFADLIAVEGDPLQDLSALQRVRFVMKEGAVFKSP